MIRSNYWIWLLCDLENYAVLVGFRPQSHPVIGRGIYINQKLINILNVNNNKRLFSG